MISKLVAITLTVFILAFAASVSLAAEEPTAITNKNSHYSFVISGGISLGNYEAGVNWAIMRTLRFENAGSRSALRSVVGASAGGINTLANAAYWCIANASSDGGESGFMDTVDDNIFKNIWNGVGFDELLPVSSSGYLENDGLLSRRKIDESRDMLKRYIAGSSYVDCRIPFAITLTKVDTQSVGIMNVIASNNRYVVPMCFVTNSSGAYFENLSVLDSGASSLMGSRVYLPTIDGTHVHMSDVLEAVKATSAFPVAFGTMKLRVCELKKRDEAGTVMEEVCGDVEFLDGGVLDNVPFGTAVAISNVPGDPAPISFIMIDPENTRLNQQKQEPLVNSTRASPGEKSFMDQLRFVAGFYSAARDYELYSSLRYVNVVLGNDANKVNIQRTMRFPLLTGNYMIAFGAFLDSAFRKYDYYAGVYDGVINIAQMRCGGYYYGCLSDEAHNIYNSLAISNSPDADMVFKYLAREEFGNRPSWEWVQGRPVDSDVPTTIGEKCISILSERQFKCVEDERKRMWAARRIYPANAPGFIAGCMEKKDSPECSVALYAVANSIYLDHDDLKPEPPFDVFLDRVNHLYSIDSSRAGVGEMSGALKDMLTSEGWGNPLLKRALTRLKYKDEHSKGGGLGPLFGLGGSVVQAQIERQKWFVWNRSTASSGLLQALPYEWSTNLNTRGLQLSWENRMRVFDFKPKMNFYSLAVTGRLGVGAEESVILEREGDEHWYVVAQPFLTLEGGLITVGVAPYSYTWMRDYQSMGYAAYVGFLDDRIRLTYGERERGRTKFRKDSYVTIGIADLSGLLEWLF